MSTCLLDAREREAKAGGAACNQPGKLLLGRGERGRHGRWFRVGEKLANSKEINSAKAVKQQVS
jgi:hypothetical protein